MNKIFCLHIVKPDGLFYQGEAFFLEFTSSEGERGIYAGHIPLIAILKRGPVRIHTEQGVKKAKVEEGFIEIQQDAVIILTEGALWQEKV